MQEARESVTEFLKTLKQLRKDYKFTVVINTRESKYIKESFISGLRNFCIREHLLENDAVTLGNTFLQAMVLELAESYSAIYMNVFQFIPITALDL